MRLRNYLSNLTKYPRQSIDQDRVNPVINMGYKPDGTPISPFDSYGYRQYPAIRRFSDLNNDLSGDTAIFTSSDNVVTEIIRIIASIKAGAGVADRTFNIRIPDLGTDSSAASQPNSFFADQDVSIQATEYGWIEWMKGADGTMWRIDNGSAGRLTSKFPPEIWMGPGGDIWSVITANKQSDENVGLDVLYREYPLIDLGD